jgi:RNA polymerase subunit RPABC4/transcription elongation factor Spt4
MSKPKDDPRGEWSFICESCGDVIDQDHDYCSPCDQHGGSWVLIDENGDEVAA